MRLLLDADISPAVAAALRDRGHDVVGAREHRTLERLTDEALLALATQEGRVLVTYNVRDYLLLARQLAHSERAHGGIVVIHAKSIPQRDIGALVRALEILLRDRAESLANQTRFLTGGRRGRRQGAAPT